MTFQEFCDKLEAKIIDSYETGVTVEQAEHLASEFLAAQIRVSSELKNRDLDARMKKSSLKSLRSRIYMDISTRDEKKPTEAMIAAKLDIELEEANSTAQTDLDTAEVNRDELERYFGIFQNAHVHYRNVAKGRFD